MAASILFVGDIHLGRRPASLPSDLEEWGLSPSALTPAAAWNATIDLALRERVDAVVLAGDVVESDNAAFEALGRLRSGVERLLQGGIETWAVAGNHDVKALPRLADLISEFHLIGRDGRWEGATVRHDGRPVARLVGWSFPSPEFSSNPLLCGELPPKSGDGLPLFGVLHCDLDAAVGGYAPVKRSELERTGIPWWFLGHVHKPSDLGVDQPIGYLGSLVGLDPTETGAHGPWLVRAGETVTVEQIPLAPLRWEEITVPVDDLTAAQDLLGAIDAAFGKLHADLPEAVGTRAVGCRVRLTGSTRIHREIRRLLEGEAPGAHSTSLHGVLYFVDKVIDRSRPALRLEELAGEHHPPGLLARRLLVLESGDAEASAMIQRARTQLEKVLREPQWQHPELVEKSELADERVRDLLIDSGLQALEELLRQTGERST